MGGNSYVPILSRLAFLTRCPWDSLVQSMSARNVDTSTHLPKPSATVRALVAVSPSRRPQSRARGHRVRLPLLSDSQPASRLGPMFAQRKDRRTRAWVRVWMSMLRNVLSHSSVSAGLSSFSCYLCLIALALNQHAWLSESWTMKAVGASV